MGSGEWGVGSGERGERGVGGTWRQAESSCA